MSTAGWPGRGRFRDNEVDMNESTKQQLHPCEGKEWLLRKPCSILPASLHDDNKGKTILSACLFICFLGNRRVVCSLYFAHLLFKMMFSKVGRAILQMFASQWTPTNIRKYKYKGISSDGGAGVGSYHFTWVLFSICFQKLPSEDRLHCPRVAFNHQNLGTDWKIVIFLMNLRK